MTNGTGLSVKETTNLMPGMALEGQEGLYDLVQKTIDVPADLVYKVGKGEGGFYASLYDLGAREIGIRFETADILYRDDYRVQVGVRCHYWNRAGKTVEDYEVYEVDCRIMYEKSRFEAAYEWRKIEGRNQQVVRKDCAITVVRDSTNPANPPAVIIELPDDDERDLYENFLTLRRNMVAKAITCCHRRLTQRAMGIKKFAFDTEDAKWDEKVRLTLYSFLPANADREAGIKAVNDLTGDELPEKKGSTEEKPTAKDSEKKPDEEKPAEKKKEDKPAGGPPPGPKTGIFCEAEGCGAEVSQKVADFSKKKFKKVLCFECQKAGE